MSVNPKDYRVKITAMWFWYAVASAVASAISITFNKHSLRKIHAPLLSWALFAFSLPTLAAIVLVNGIPDFNYKLLFSALLAAILFSIAKTITLVLMKNNKLSEFYPLVATSPLMLYVLGLIILSETVKFVSFLGLITIIMGVYLFNFEKRTKDFLHPIKTLFYNPVSRLFLFGILLANFTALFEKIAVLNTNPSSPEFVLFIEYSLITIFLSGYMTHKDKYWFKEIKTNFKNLFIAGTIFSILAILVVTSFITGSIALVSAIKKLEVVFMLIIGSIFLGDKPGKKVYVATIIMILGVLLIRI